MKIFTLIIIGLALAGFLVRTVKVLLNKDKTSQAIGKQQLAQISLSLVFGLLLYFLILMYADDSLRSYYILIGIPLLGLQGGRFMYKFMQLRKEAKEAGTR